MNERYEVIVVAHGVDNLYVVDTSLFPSIGAMNPALTPWPTRSASASMC